MADSPQDEKIITHAHAYHRHDRFEITACCDPDSDNLSRFKQRWSEDVYLYDDIDHLLDNEECEVVSVSSPTETHGEIILKLLEKDSVRLIICEKPLVSSTDELHRIRDSVKRHPEKKLLVNYHRAYDPGFQEVVNTIDSGQLGRPVHFAGVFSKGLYHNGCHMLELIERCLGDISGVIANENTVSDGDLYGCYHLRTEQCSGVLANNALPDYSVFDLDIYLERGRVRITDFGHRLEIHVPTESTLYPGYRMLQPSRIIDDTFKRSMLHVVEWGRQLLENDIMRDEDIFARHMVLSEKMLILKREFSSGAREIAFDDIRSL